MISEAFFIIIVTGALNGAMCYGLYFKIKRDLCEIKTHLLPSVEDKEQIELQVLDKLNTPEPSSPDPEALFRTNEASGVPEFEKETVRCEEDKTLDTEATEEVKDALETIICGTSCHVGDRVDKSLLTNEVMKSDSSTPPGQPAEPVKKKATNSFLGLGSWLWQQDKTLSRKENCTDDNSQSTPDENA